MQAISYILKELETVGYLSARLAKNANGIEVLKLLKNGKNYSEQFKAQWLRTIDKQMPTYHHQQQHQQQQQHKKHLAVIDENPYTFIFTKEFQENIEILKQKCPGIVKRIMHYDVTARMSSNNKNTAAQNAFQLSNNENGCTELITDYFVHPSLGKEKFYNIQRARKISWMLYSANASRYNLEAAIDGAQEQHSKLNAGCQTVNITSHFSFGNSIVEQLSFVPLREVVADYKLYDINTKTSIQPSIIRSTINLELAACALIFDGFEQRGDGSLLIDRNLAPIQCALICLDDVEVKISKNLHDLCRHIIYVIRQEIGLRVSDEIYTNSMQQIDTEFNQLDNLGVPYAIIITKNSLNDGLLQLRNRDTTLAEIIHISDIKPYFNCIFKPHDVM